MNQKWKNLMIIGLVLVLLLALAGCQGTPAAPAQTEQAAVPMQTDVPAAEAADPQASEPSEAAASTEAAPESEDAEPEAAGKDTLVVYFSATGTTKAVAEQIAAITGADLYEIKAAQEYTDADLDWHDSSSRTTFEQNDKTARPEIGSEPISLEGYTTVYIGYPIWWGEEPRILDTFVERYDFDGITLIPFCTSGGSGIGRSGQNLAENAGSGTWLEGRRFGAGPSEAELQDWINSLN